MIYLNNCPLTSPKLCRIFFLAAIMPSTHFLPIFVLCPHFCNWAHCHLVKIFTSWIWIGLVTVRTHLESRLSGSMGRVISLCSISPSAYFCLHRWCAASSVSLVRPCQPPPQPPPPFSLTLHHHTTISWRQQQGTTDTHNGRRGGRKSLDLIKSSIVCVSKLHSDSTGFGWEQYLCLIRQEAASNVQRIE